MEANKIIQKEEEMMANIREIINQIVGIRFKAQKDVTWLVSQSTELANASEEMMEAIDALYNAENALGNVHQHLLVSQATTKCFIMSETDM